MQRSMPEALVRAARPEEAGTLTGIAVASKAHWGYDDEFIARAAAVLVLDADYVQRNDVWLAEIGGEVVGFYGLLHDGSVAVLDHLWLLPAHIGRGVGRVLFEHARQRAAARGALRLELEAEPHAAGFYRRMGGAPVRKVTTELGRLFDVYSFELSGSSASSADAGASSDGGSVVAGRG